MKLLNRTLTCGGKLGCGMVFEFPEGATTEQASETLRKHREEPGHDKRAFEETNVRRAMDGLAPVTMEEFFGKSIESTEKLEQSLGGPLWEAMKEDEAASMKTFKEQIARLKVEFKQEER